MADFEYIVPSLWPLAVPLDSVKRDPDNVREGHDIPGLMASLEEYKQRRPIVVNSNGRFIEAGNGTHEAAEKLGWTHIAAVLVEDNDETAARFAIADNRLGDKSAFNLAKLIDTVDKLDLPVEDLNIGFDSKALDDIIKQLETAKGNEGNGNEGDDTPPNVEEANRLKKKWKTEEGQVWELPTGDGRFHRLIIAKAEDPDTPRLLFKRVKEVAFAMATDPPYGVNFAGQKYQFTQKYTKQWDAIEGDRREGDELSQFMTAVIQNWMPYVSKKAGFYFWSAPLDEGYAIKKGVDASGLHVQGQIVWNKNFLVMGQADHQWKHEIAWYAFFKGERHRWFGGRNKTTVWNVDRVATNAYLHPNQKPVELYERPYKYHTKEGEIVVDPFAGSLTSVIAAQNLGRIAYVSEMDTNWAAVGLERYFEHTGQTPILKG